MKTFEINQPVTAAALNESLHKQFNVRINFDKYTRAQLEDYRNILRTKVHQLEGEANFNDLLTNENYQRDKFVLGVLNTKIKEMLGEAKLAEKAVSKAQQKFMGMVHAAQKGEKPASKEVAKAARGMSKKAAKDFAATKHKGLPAHVNEEQIDELSPETIKSARNQRYGQLTKIAQTGQRRAGSNMAHGARPTPDTINQYHDSEKRAIDGDFRDSAKAGFSERPGDREQAYANNDRNRTRNMSRGNMINVANKKLAGTANVPARSVEGTTMRTNEAKKAKPDFLDMDKDGNKKEPMKKAVKDAKIKEAAKPDYIDLDKDGNKKEPMKKAAKDAKKKKMAEGKMSAADRAHHHAVEYERHHKQGNLEMALHHRDACDECGGMIQHGPMGECWHMHSGKNGGTPYRVSDDTAHNMIMTQESRKFFRLRRTAIAESIATYIAEDEEGKAKAITAGSDMVNDFTTWMQRVGNYQTKSMIELADNIRANFGVQEAERFKGTVGQALEGALQSLTATREEINNAVAVLAGEAPAEEQMGQEPMLGNENPMQPGDEYTGQEADDEFAASDAAAGGIETAGRMKRESIERGNRLMRILGS
jgi:hypothetical protein